VVAHGEFVDSGTLDVAADGEKTRSAVAWRPGLRKGRAAHVDDVRYGSDGLGVIDHRGAAVETDDCRKRRLDAWDAALAFERFHQSGLFADFVCARAALGDD